MKKSLLLLALFTPFAVHTGLNAMQGVADESNTVARTFFEKIQEKLAEGTLTNTDVRDRLETIAIEKKGHPALVDRAFSVLLAGAAGDKLFEYLQAVTAKVNAGEALTDTEKKQAAGIYQLVMTKQSLPETERFKRMYSLPFIKAISPSK